MVMNDEVNRVFVTYKDRLTRFGFNYLETMFNAKGVEIIIVKQKIEEISVEQELMNDMMSLIASFQVNYMVCGQKVNGQKERIYIMTNPRKEMTLQELEELIGKEQVERLFLEHYLILVGKDKEAVKLVDDLTLNDIME